MAAIFSDVYGFVQRKNVDLRMIIADRKQLIYLNFICTFRDPVLG